MANAQPAAVKALIQGRADISAQDPQKTYSLIHEAAKRNDSASIQMLVECKASINLLGLSPCSPVLFVLVEISYVCMCTGPRRGTPLHVACSTGQVEAVKTLLSLKAATDLRDDVRPVFVCASFHQKICCC